MLTPGNLSKPSSGIPSRIIAGALSLSVAAHVTDAIAQESSTDEITNQAVLLVDQADNYDRALQSDSGLGAILNSDTWYISDNHREDLERLLEPGTMTQFLVLPSVYGESAVAAFRMHTIERNAIQTLGEEKGLPSVEEYISAIVQVVQGTQGVVLVNQEDDSSCDVVATFLRAHEEYQDPKWRQVFEKCHDIFFRIQQACESEPESFPYHLRGHVDNTLSEIRKRYGEEQYVSAKKILKSTSGFPYLYQANILVWAHKNPTFADFEELLVQADEIRKEGPWGPKIYVSWFEGYIQKYAAAIDEEDRGEIYEGLCAVRPPYQTQISPEVRELAKNHLESLWGLGKPGSDETVITKAVE